MRGLGMMLLAGVAGASMTALGGAARADEAPETTEVESLTVTGVHEDKPVATKSGVSVLETPQAVSVVTAERLEEQGITRLADALRNVAGVSRSSTYGYYDAYQIRGYDAAYGSIFLDGLTSANVAGAVAELSGLEQVEVIKGPASALFGASPLGGIVNLVSKRPTGETAMDVGLATGSYNLFEAKVDAQAPLLGKTLSGRINLLYRDADDFVDFAHGQRIYIAPALTWRPTDDTTLTLLARYQRDYDSPWSPVVAQGTILPSAFGDLPINFSVNSNGALAAVNNQNSKQIGYVLDHAFAEAVSFSQTVRYEERSIFWNRWMFAAGVTGTTLGRMLYGPFSQSDKDFAADSRFKVKFATGGVSHLVMAGFDYRHNDNDMAGTGNYNPAANEIDILNPDYSAPMVPDPSEDYTLTGTSRQTGFYLHDHMTLGQALTVTLGGRWDIAEMDGQKDKKFSPHAGMTWMVRPGASLYASYSKSFTPTPSWQVAFDGSLLPPETGENIEAGLKLEEPGGRLSGQMAIYQLTRQNVATDDPDQVNHAGFYVVTGEQRSRGIEVEGVWRPNEATEVALAYAHIKAEVTKDNFFPIGIPLANFPEHSLSLWGKYDVQTGPLTKLGLSLGLVYNSDRHFYEYGDRVYTLPSYMLLDAGISYPFAGWTLQFNVDNLTNERFFPDACCLDRVTPGEPRSWRLGLRRSF